MPESIKTIELSKKTAAIILAAAVIGALIFLWFAVRWQLGNMLAQLTRPTQPNAVRVADLAVGLAPGDPLSRWLRAAIEKEALPKESIERAVRMFEEAVRASPNDYRWWIELGRAYEQAEKPEAAEQALLRAIDLAPAYTFPKWQLGNFYLRQGRTEEAFAELMKTTEKSSVYREQVFSLAWDYFDQDGAQVERFASDAPDVRISLAMFFAARGASEDALRNWNMLTDEQKAEDPRLPRIMAQGLYDRRHFRESVEFARQSGLDPDATIGAVTNGDFEKFIGAPEETLFGWRTYRSDGRIDVTPDSGVKRSGNRSLRVTFKGYVKPELYNVVQMVAVEPLAKYRFTWWTRTENIRSGGPPFLQIVNANDDTQIAAGPPYDTATQEWTQRTLEFTAPENCTGISIRTVRIGCGEECPINGTLWYDDFVLTKL
ncbi:hypothetical protein BH24ACI3_BH24ACI3_14390 [soil metagenome]